VAEAQSPAGAADVVIDLNNDEDKEYSVGVPGQLSEYFVSGAFG
jgi:hypothetical protein